MFAEVIITIVRHLINNDEYFIATAGSSADECKIAYKRQVSFKSPTRPDRRKSDTPPESDLESDRKVRRRSSCKLPTLGYDSSSEEEELVFPQQKLFQIQQENKGSPNKIPRLGDESSADSLGKVL